MSDERGETERHPTDEPDGTPAYAASLRKPGESTGPSGDEPDADVAPDDNAGMYRPD